MSNFDRFIHGVPLVDLQALSARTEEVVKNSIDKYGYIPETYSDDNIQSSSSEDELTLEVIIVEKPAVKEVREFFREVLRGIKSEEENLFT